MKITNELREDLLITGRQIIIFSILAFGIACKLSSCSPKHCPSYGKSSKEISHKQFVKCGTREAKLKKMYYASIQYR